MSLLQYARRIDLAIAAEENPQRAEALTAYQKEVEKAIDEALTMAPMPELAGVR